MQITVFGANGKVGKLVVRLAVAQGYTVVAFVHKSNPFIDESKVRVVQGDVSDQQKVEEALKGSEAVISTLGSWHTKSKRILTTAMENIIPIMERMQVHRIITLTGAGAIAPNDQMMFLDKLNHRLLASMAPKILRDGEDHIKLLSESTLDWTCVRSPVMTRSVRTNFRLGLEPSPAWAIIPRAAVSASLVEQITNKDFLRAAPVIYAK